MSFGLQFRNNNDVVTLDSEFSRLVILYTARFGDGGVRGASFPVPITSAEPPLIFARPDGGGGTFQWVRLLGGPGNWTGFLNESTTVGTYFLAAYSSTPTATFGLRLWDANSKLLFDNGTPCAQITAVATAYNYLGAVNTSPGRWFQSWNTATPIANGDFMLINNIAYDLPGSSTYSKLSCGLNYTTSAVTVTLSNIGDFSPNGLFLPLIFAKQIPN